MRKLVALRGMLVSGILLAGCTLNLPGVNVAPPAVPTSTATTASAAASATPSPTATLPQPTSTATSTPAPVGPPLEKLQAGLEITVRTVRMVDATRGWAIGGLATASDHILRTSDAGVTWRDVSPPQAEQTGTRMMAVGAFHDASTAWVAYSLANPGETPQVALVWRTQDGGATWIASEPLDIDPLMGIYQPSDLLFADADHGWLLVHAGAGINHDYIAIYRSMDGGRAWSKIVDPFITDNVQSCYKTGLLFTSPLEGWMTGDCGGVAPGVLFFHSSDGGENWDLVRLPPPPETPGLFESSEAACGADSLTFPDAQHGRMVVFCRMYSETPWRDAYYLYVSDNGGRLWLPMSFPGEQAVFLTPDLGWAVGAVVRRTTDAGRTWSEMGKVTWQGQFSFVSDTLGWAVAHEDEDYAFVASKDGGRDWMILKPKTVAP